MYLIYYVRYSNLIICEYFMIICALNINILCFSFLLIDILYKKKKTHYVYIKKYDNEM